MWAPSREEAEGKGAFHQKTKHGGKVMVWLGVCAKALTIAVNFSKRSDECRDLHINEVLPIALECGDKILGSNWTYEEDSATPHIYHLTEETVCQTFS